MQANSQLYVLTKSVQGELKAEQWAKKQTRSGEKVMDAVNIYKYIQLWL